MFHDVILLDAPVEPERLTMIFFAAGAGFVIFMGPLHDIIFRIFFEYYTLLKGVLGAMQKDVFSAPVVFLLGETEFFVLRLPVRPLLGLVIEADSPPFRFLT